jgi:nucleoside-diphosphate-sugar epimerase
MKSKKKALVTGGAGFIGSNVVQYLLGKEWEVRVVDNLSSGYESNLEGLDVEFIKGDIGNAQVTNLVGTVNVLEGMRRHNVKRIVYSSSAAIFGELTASSIAEDHPQNADSPYGVSKLAAEKMIFVYSGLYGITGICLRYFNIYGVNQRYDLYGNVIPIFAKRIHAGEPLTIYGDGEQTRDFVNVKDVARANYLAATCDNGTAVYNLGSGNSITINRLAERMQAVARRNVGIRYAPQRPADVRHCKAQIVKAREDLGFETAIGLDQGLEEYMAWFAKDAGRP